MDAISVLTSRVSPVKLREPGPSPQELEKIMAAALRAPDHGRLQPWRILLIEGSARQRFGEVLAEALRAREPEAPQERLDAERSKPLRAPLVVVVAARTQPEHKIPELEQIVSAGAAAQNILLAAHALGYGGFWRTGESAYDKAVVRALGLEQSDRIIGFLYLGTIAVPGQIRAIEPSAIVSAWREPGPA